MNTLQGLLRFKNIRTQVFRKVRLGRLSNKTGETQSVKIKRRDKAWRSEML